MVSDGVEALAYLRQQEPFSDAVRPDLVLLDLNLPKRDGREVLAEIKGDESLRQIPVVVLTTSREEEDILRSYDLGANSFVSKPVGFASLVQIVSGIASYWFQLVELPRVPQHA